MAGGAGAGSAASPFHLNVVCLRDVEEVVAVRDFKGVRVAVLVDEGYAASI